MISIIFIFIVSRADAHQWVQAVLSELWLTYILSCGSIYVFFFLCVIWALPASYVFILGSLVENKQLAKTPL